MAECDRILAVSDTALAVARSLRRAASAIERGEFGAHHDAGLFIALCTERLFLDQELRKEGLCPAD